MRLILRSLVSTAALAACAEQTPASPPAAPTVQPSAPDPTPTPAPPRDLPATDACGAAERQSWVGRERSSLPAMPAGARLYETGQPITEDLRPDRLNVEINPEDQRVVGVRCG